MFGPLKGVCMPCNKYQDTRGLMKQSIPFTEAVIQGLASGGGLFVPDSVPFLNLDDILALAKIPYAERAAFIYRSFGVDFSDEDLQLLMNEAYGDNFDSKDICPITTINENTHILELWHGPTSAFKDMALQCLPLFFSASAQCLRDKGKIDHKFLILVATSGDTGKAALEGFKNRQGVSIAVMYPHGGVSDIQYKQMATQQGDNVQVWAVEGNFDDCQTAAKTVFGDQAFKEKLLKEANIALSSANSINWGRLLPQVVYYVSSYAKLVEEGKLEAGEELDVCVPTGNFGNILAAYYAKRMGVPLGRLLCASNENRVLTDFINTGSYDISHRKFMRTSSPSMDILVSSNLERQLFELTGRNGNQISEWMNDLKTKQAFKVDEETFRKMRALYKADSVSDAECFEAIRQLYEETGYLLDPHTAVAYEAAQRLREDKPVLVVGTAHWAKFGESVYKALHKIAPQDNLPCEIAELTGSELNELIAKETKSSVPENLATLDSKKIRFTEIIDRNTSVVEENILKFTK